MSGLPEPEIRQYLNSIINSPAMERVRRFCENNVVNIVLASKASIMEQHQIGSEMEVSVPQEIPIPDSDLCAVFANSLDNAIEACDKLPAEQRNISVKARTDKGLFVLKLQNPFVEKTVFEHGIPITTKQDQHSHGFGLASIREIATRHGGSMEITGEESMFTLLVYFPL